MNELFIELAWHMGWVTKTAKIKDTVFAYPKNFS